MTAHDLNTFVEVVSISEIGGRLDETLSQYCSRDERHWLEKRPLQTIAGRVALKTAVCRLAREALGAIRINPKDIDITQSVDGAHWIDAVSGPDRNINTLIENNVHISISHSKDTAVGLAVIPEKRR